LCGASALAGAAQLRLCTGQCERWHSTAATHDEHGPSVCVHAGLRAPSHLRSTHLRSSTSSGSESSAAPRSWSRRPHNDPSSGTHASRRPRTTPDALPGRAYSFSLPSQLNQRGVGRRTGAPYGPVNSAQVETRQLQWRTFNREGLRDGVRPPRIVSLPGRRLTIRARPRLATARRTSSRRSRPPAVARPPAASPSTRRTQSDYAMRSRCDSGTHGASIPLA